MSEERATVVTNTCVMPGREAEFAAWQSQMSSLVEGFPGFLSAEVIPPFPPTQVDWVIVQRFQTPELLQQWLSSSQRASMLDRIKPVLVGDDAVNVFVGAEAEGPSTETTAVIMTKVATGSEDDFLTWYKGVEVAQSKYPGYLGSELQPPVPGFQDHWVTMLRFDSPDHLNAWLGSKERQAIMHQADEFVEQSVIRRTRSGFSNWFAFGSARQGMPPAWKNNWIVLLGLYPIVMLEILFLNPYMAWLPLALGNFVGNIISVGILGWPVIWLLSKWFAWWLAPGQRASRSRDWLGAILILLVIVVMGVLFTLIGFPIEDVKRL